MYSTSPPASVQARPVATPGGSAFAGSRSGRTFSGPSRSVRSVGDTVTASRAALGEAPRHLAGDAAHRSLQIADALPPVC